MKTRLLAAVVVSCFLANSCFAITHTLSGLMDPLQAESNGGFGAGTGNGSGTIEGTYDANTNTVNYTLTWMDLTSDVINMHFHKGAVGVSGGVDLGVPSPWSSPQVGSGVIDDVMEGNLLSGNWYLNIHTGQFGGGEIRGQVIVTPIPEPTSMGLTAVALLSAVTFNRRRR